MIRDIKHRYYIAIATVVFFFGSGYLGLSATPFSTAEQGAVSVPEPAPLDQADKKKQPSRIILEHADLLTADAAMYPGVQRLIGNVAFKHGNATMLCDSAYLNDSEQTFEAFGNVHMMQGDSVNIFSRYLNYDGRIRLARLRYDVRLEKPGTTVFADSLDYDRVAGMAYYFEGGSVVDEQNTLTSDYGQFYPATNDAEFRYNVRLVNDSTEMTTEHLFYNTASRIAHFEGETLIKSDSGIIKSKRGIYDLNKDIGTLLDRSEIQSGSRTIIGDSLYYDGVTKYGEAFGSMEIIDTLQKANLYGDYGYFESDRNYAFATSRAFAIDYSQSDTLFIGADTLELISLPLPDSVRAVQLMTQRVPQSKEPDSLSRLIRAYKTVRIYRKDLQALADSLVYWSLDSTLAFYQKPVIWSDNRQISGDTITLYLKNDQLDYVDVIGNTLSIEQMQDKPDYYNQLKGRRMKAYMKDSVIRRIWITDSVESVFYMKDEKSNAYNGVNRMKSQAMDLYIDSGLLKKVHWQGQAHGKLYPMHMAHTPEANRLTEFVWLSDKRPKSPEDILPIRSGQGEQDSISQTSSLQDLKRFSGANAATAAYKAFEPKPAQTSGEQADKKPIEADYKYVLRPKPQDKDKPQESIINLSWLYNPFISREDPEASTTSPSTGMYVRRSSKSESTESEER